LKKIFLAVIIQFFYLTAFAQTNERSDIPGNASDTNETSITTQNFTTSRSDTIMHHAIFGHDTTSIRQKFSITINGGISIPAQAYGYINEVPFLIYPPSTSMRMYALAMPGEQFNCTASYLFSEHWGLMFIAGGSINRFDQSAYQTYIINNTDNATNVQPTVHASGSFYIGQYLIGPCLSRSINSKFSLQLSILFGVITANYPTIIEKTPDQAGSPFFTNGIVLDTYTTTTKSAVDFGSYIGASIKYSITKHIGIDISAGYTGSTITYPQVNRTYAQGANPPSKSQTYLTNSMSLGIIQFTGGISYNW